MMMYGHSHDKFDKGYSKYYLNTIYGISSWLWRSIQDENESLKAENESLKAELQKIEKKVETYAFDIEKYAEELACAKADLAKALAKANLAIKQLTSILANAYSRKDAGEDECKTEVQEAKEEDRATRESKDTD